MFGFAPKNVEKLYLSSSLIIESINPNLTLLYYDVINKVVYATDSEILNLYESRNNGKTWKIIFTFQYGIKGLYRTSTGAWIFWSNSTRIYRVSSDFASIVVKSDAYRKPPLNVNLGVAEYNGVIMYGEYGHDVNEIWKSTDDGVTWTISDDGSGDTHWHTLQLDPYTNNFWATSGDTAKRIMNTTDAGVTWNVIDTDPTTSTTRCVGLVFRKNEIMWAMDTASTVQKVFKSARTPWSRVEVGVTSTVGIGAVKTLDNKMLIAGRAEVNTVGDVDEVPLLLTDGVTIKKIMGVEITPSSSVAFGEAILSQVDNNNRVWVQFRSTRLKGLCSILLPFGGLS